MKYSISNATAFLKFSSSQFLESANVSFIASSIGFAMSSIFFKCVGCIDNEVSAKMFRKSSFELTTKRIDLSTF